jgi:hypothetical protein
MPENLKNDADIHNTITKKIIDEINSRQLEKSDYILYDFRDDQCVLNTIYQKYGSYQFDVTNGVLEYGDD